MLEKMNNFYFRLFLLFMAVLCSTFFSLKIGGVENISNLDIYLFLKKGGEGSFIISELRLPRVLLCWMIGPLLATSGLLFQSLTKNPMGSPDILGVNSVSSFMGIFFILYFSFLPQWLLPVFVFFGGILCGFLIFFLSKGSRVSPTKLAIIGVAIHVLFSSFIQLIISLKSLEIQMALTWLSGSFWGKSLEDLKVPFLMACGFLVLPYFFIKKINILIFDDETAEVLGENPKGTKSLLLILAIICSSLAVSLTGPVGFIALLAPQMARNLTDYKLQKILPIASLIGTLLLLWADSLGRTFLSPLEIPVGVVTCFIGAPAFFFTFWRRARKEKIGGTV